jgi:hypothetical protein
MIAPHQLMDSSLHEDEVHMFGPRSCHPQCGDVFQQRLQLKDILHGGLCVPPRLMLQPVPTGLQQLGMMVVHVEPLLLPVLVGVDALVRQVLGGGVFTHLDSSTADKPGVIYARLGLQLEELPKEYLVWLDSYESFAKMDKHEGVEDTI